MKHKWQNVYFKEHQPKTTDQPLKHLIYYSVSTLRTYPLKIHVTGAPGYLFIHSVFQSTNHVEAVQCRYRSRASQQTWEWGKNLMVSVPLNLMYWNFGHLRTIHRGVFPYSYLISENQASSHKLLFWLCCTVSIGLMERHLQICVP